MKKNDLVSVINGLKGVTILDDDIAEVSDVQEYTPNTKYVRISFFIADEYEENSLRVSQTVPTPTNYRIKNIVPQSEINSDEHVTMHTLQIIKAHIQRYGTIQEIRFTGHANIGVMGEDGNIFIRPFLNKLTKLEKELNVKIANRIVFDGCNTFSHLNEAAIHYFSDYARDHQVQLVGTTSKSSITTYSEINIRSGRYVQFAPNGKIIRDKLDTRYNPMVFILGNDRSWTDFYIGHTPDEGVAIKKAYEAQQQNDIKILEQQIKIERFCPKF